MRARVCDASQYDLVTSVNMGIYFSRKTKCCVGRGWKGWEDECMCWVIVKLLKSIQCLYVRL